jgi:uncharacterized protein (DUF1501 family)
MADDLTRHGPNPAEAALRLHADAVTAELAAQKDRWLGGFTRRRVLAGAGAVGVASLGTQLVTTRVAFGDPATNNRTLVAVFLRGGMDGLSVVVPAGDPNYKAARPVIAVPDSVLIPAGRNFGLNPALAPLRPLWTAGQLAAVHAVASPDASRSHFQAQDCLERGAASTSVHSGWLDRTLAALGPGTTFRAVAEGSALPRSMVGGQDKVVLAGVANFRLTSPDNLRAKSVAALQALYTGLDHPLSTQANLTLQALAAAAQVAKTPVSTTAGYPGGGFASSLKDVARLIKAKVGLRVATINLGGWDMHTAIGKVDNGEMKNQLGDLATTLAAFAADVGPAMSDVTLVTMSEFGRRVQENSNAGADHGHGGVMLLMGGGLVGGQVHGKWPGLSAGALDHGDLAGANDYRDVLGELLVRRMGVGSVSDIFPGHQYNRIGVFS